MEPRGFSIMKLAGVGLALLLGLFLFLQRSPKLAPHSDEHELSASSIAPTLALAPTSAAAARLPVLAQKSLADSHLRIEDLKASAGAKSTQLLSLSEIKPTQVEPAVTRMQALMSAQHEALQNHSAAEKLLARYEECLQAPAAQQNQGMELVCASNAQSLGVKFPDLANRAQKIASLGSGGRTSIPVAPPMGQQAHPKP